MLGAFVAVIVLGHLALWAMVICIQVTMFREVVRLGYRVAMERGAPGQRALQWYWFVVALVFVNGRLLLQNHFNGQHTDKLNLSIFALYTAGMFCSRWIRVYRVGPPSVPALSSLSFSLVP